MSKSPTESKSTELLKHLISGKLEIPQGVGPKEVTKEYWDKFTM